MSLRGQVAAEPINAKCSAVPQHTHPTNLFLATNSSLGASTRLVDGPSMYPAMDMEPIAAHYRTLVGSLGKSIFERLPITEESAISLSIASEPVFQDTTPECNTILFHLSTAHGGMRYSVITGTRT